MAHSFVKESTSNAATIPDVTTRASIQADQEIITSSLTFVDKFLQSMLLMYRASAKKLAAAALKKNLARTKENLLLKKKILEMAMQLQEKESA